ncbi:SpaH/EbpB family LPXTG-anchored major pilin [Lactobacillus delbrueckii]|uniref:SpaH/EbpB family LPXTG-anchored major pilin n=1 Tax=Lactobacillus delbrueckii TaxID=1584 RepID=UPI0022E919FB|nr:SpaH/EbpB family LPXTG-anchored major pilin [Lactobacillus delbrueckii]
MKRGKLATLLAAFTLAAAPILSNAGLVSATEDNYSTTKPDRVAVAIHKYKTTSDLSDKIKSNHDSNPDFDTKSTSNLKNLLRLGDSDNLEPMANVKFEYFKVNDSDKLADLANKSVKELEAAYSTKGTMTTDPSGSATKVILEKDYGKYYFVELTKTDSAFETAPFLLEVPSYISGKGYAKTMNIYPKSKVTTPTPGEDVSGLGTNHDSAKVGDQVKWFLKGTIPADIDTYKNYEFSDTLDSALTYDKSFTPVVTVGTTKLNAADDYTVTEPTAGSNVFQVSLTDAGRKKAYAAYQAAGKTPSAEEIKDITKNIDDNPFIEVEFATTINEKAVMGKNIDNKVTLNYDNGGNVSGHSDSDTPEVHTGGIRFITKDAVNGNVLKGAVFELYEADDTTPVKWTKAMIKANGTTGFKDQEVGKQVKLVSNEYGTFEIKGLKYREAGKNNEEASTKYVLREVTPPDGYNPPANADIPVTVNKVSYYKDPTSTHLVVADPVEILNNKTLLPMTGGIGALIFALTGLAAVGFAFYEIKKRRQA